MSREEIKGLVRDLSSLVRRLCVNLTDTTPIDCTTIEDAAQALTALLAENERLREAMKRVKDHLTIAAAEYVPAIPEAWGIIDDAFNESQSQ